MSRFKNLDSTLTDINLTIDVLTSLRSSLVAIDKEEDPAKVWNMAEEASGDADVVRDTGQRIMDDLDKIMMEVEDDA